MLSQPKNDTADHVSNWSSVEISLEQATELKVELFTAALFESGVAGTEQRGEGPEMLVIASFPPEIDRETITETVQNCVDATGLALVKVEINEVEPIDWETHWRTHFHPLGFGKFWVVPSWLEAPAEAEQVLIVDPGMAFGTGRHETTSLCLRRIVEGTVPASVLDVGTGTAILAMAAIMNGATRVVGTDNDPDALVVARENAERNGLSEHLELSGDDPDVLQEEFELVVANILRDPLIELAPKIVSATKVGGNVVLSGILERQVADVRAAYESCGLQYVEHAVEGEWARLEMTKT